mgnify:CR=1 FL=1
MVAMMKQISKTAKDRGIEFVIKRSGKKDNFDWEKIVKSVVKAGKDTKAYGEKEAKIILKEIRESLDKLGLREVSSAQIRDVVEPAMAHGGFFQTAKYYILFGERKHQKDKHNKEIVEPEISPMGMEIARKRYLRTNMKGEVIESLGEMFWRVARHMAKAELNWSNNGEYDETTGAFYERLVNWKFVCAGKAMFEAGNPGGTGQLSSCFVLPIEDNIARIFKTLGDAAVVHKNNGGTGFNFSKIRPQGDKVRNVPGAATGPVGFIKAYSAVLGQILQGAKRQGANIAILNVDHPDIEEFITMKDEDGTIKNFNISVGVTDAFMEAVLEDKMWNLVNPRTGEITRRVSAKRLFATIVEHAWIGGDPGLAFLDRLEEDNPTPTLGALNATNPCGEIPLLPYESCNLTSIILHNHLINKSEDGDDKYEIDWDDLARSVKVGIRFLDNMIEVNTYALKEIEDMVKNGNRRIGLGVMGFAHMLYMMKIPYNSKEAVSLAGRIAKFIQKNAEEMSLELARIRGVFPHFDISVYAGSAERYRNCALTMIAPTGTISMLANTSSGIEPVFSLVTLKRVFNEDNRDNKPTREFMIVDPVFEGVVNNLDLKKVVRSSGEKILSVDDLLTVVAEEGLHGVRGLPEWVYKVFVTTHEIKPTWHVQIQAAWQKWFDNSISKTINFANEASVEDVKEAYLQAWRLGCKGITIYRDGSKQDQVLNLAKPKSLKKEEVKSVDLVAKVETVGVQAIKPGSGDAVVCEECGAGAIYRDGCVSCPQCGWSKCTM